MTSLSHLILSPYLLKKKVYAFQESSLLFAVDGRSAWCRKQRKTFYFNKKKSLEKKANKFP